MFSKVRHALGLDMTFHNAHTPGEMIERVDGDVTDLGNFLSKFVVQITANVLLLLGILAFLFLEDWRAGAGIAAFAAVSLIAMIGMRNLAVPFWKKTREAAAALFGFLEERLSGTEDIRSSNATAYVMNGFYKLSRRWWKAETASAVRVNLLFNTNMLLFVIGTAASLAIGAWLFQRGTATIGTVYLLFHYTSLLVRPLEAIVGQLEDLQRAGGSGSRVIEILNTRSKLINAGERRLPPVR